MFIDSNLEYSLERKLVEFEEELKSYIDINQNVLVALGVGHPALDKVINVSKANGGFHSKLTGAGGGGCAITLINRGTNRDQVDLLKQKLQAEGFDCFEAATGAPGVVFHD